MRFQSTPPRGWRLPLPEPYKEAEGYFNPLHREGGDNDIDKIIYTHVISIHSTARVETDPQWPCSSAHHNFNPLHREGGDIPEGGMAVQP